MATHLNLEDQEQLEQLKSFWKQFGNPITWLLIVVLGAFAAWNGWNWWQRDQAIKAGAMYDELDKAAQASDADRTSRIFADMKERFSGTAYTQQAALLTAKVQLDKGQADAAVVTLAWVAEHAPETEYRTVARLRAAGILLDQKKYDEALKQLDAAPSPEFEALMLDRRGDILFAQGKKAEAQAAFIKAYAAMDPKVDYRRLIEAKLTSLGAAPPAEAAASGAAS